jgi:hypothetical protein
MVFQGDYDKLPPQWTTTDIMVRVVAPVAHCHALLYITGAFVALAMSSTSLLFFYRVRAVYSNSCIITSLFGFLWVATSGLSILNSITIYGGVSPFAPILFSISAQNPHTSASLVAFI